MAPAWFTLGWIDVPSFTALMALALGVGLGLTWSTARRSSLTQSDILDAALVGVLIGVIAARAMYVSDHWSYFRDHTDQIAPLWLGGLSWHGGLIGGAIGTAAFSAWRKLDVRQVFDALTPGLMAGAALGWIGCYLAGVAYGREVFPGDAGWFLAADLPDIYGLRNPRFATQLMGAAWAAVCFIVAMLKVERRTSNAQIHLASFALTLTLYSLGMFVLGFARGDVVPMLGAWRLDQVIDTGIVVAGVAYGFRPWSFVFRQTNDRHT